MSEESSSKRQGMAKQSSFARSFFNSEANPPALEQQGDPDEYRPESRRRRRSSKSKRKPSISTESFAMAATAAVSDDHKKPAAGLKTDSTAAVATDDSWYAEAGSNELLGGAPRGDGKSEGESWNDDEVLEQYRLMAQHEASARVMENTGFDPREYERRRKMDEPEKDKKGLYGGSKKPRQKLPEPRKITASSNDIVLKPVDAPKPPALKHTRYIEQKVEQRVAELCPGVAITGSSSKQVFSSDEHVVKCLGSCDKQLRVHRLATLVSCPICHTVSPATSFRVVS